MVGPLWKLWNSISKYNIAQWQIQYLWVQMKLSFCLKVINGSILFILSLCHWILTVIRILNEISITNNVMTLKEWKVLSITLINYKSYHYYFFIRYNYQWNTKVKLCHQIILSDNNCICTNNYYSPGADPGGGGTSGACPPPKKNWKKYDFLA
jgi:hypothetical protein